VTHSTHANPAAAAGASDDQAVRHRILGIYTTTCLTLGPLYAGFFAVFGAWISLWVPLAFTVASAAAYVAWRRNDDRTGTALVVGALWLAPAFVVLTTGGLASPIVIWLAPTPFMAGALAGRRAAVLVGSASVAWVLVVGLAGPWVQIADEMSAPLARTVLGLACGTTAIALLAFFGYSTTRSFEDAQAELRAQHAALDASARAMARRNAEMRAVLDHVEQGLMVVGLDGKMGQEVSAALARWFGPPREGATLWDFAGAHDPTIGATLELGWGDLADGLMPTELILEQLPRQYAAEGRTWSIDYRPVPGESSELGGVLLVMTEVTERLEAERRSACAADVLRMFEAYLAGPAAVLRSAKEVGSLIDALEHEPDEAVARRILHTVKGCAAMVGAQTVAKAAHALEDQADAAESLRGLDLAPLRRAWAAIAERIRSWAATDDSLRISRDDHRALVGELTRLRMPSDLIDVVDAWGLDRSAARLQPLAQEVKRVAERLGKPEPEVTIEDNGIALPDDCYADVCTNMVHVVRNAMDHGVESPEQRLAAGKPAQGRVTFRVARHVERLRIEVVDDGRGIAWERLAASLRSKGLPADTHAERVQGLFADGVSTAAQVSDLSGRGVGLAALHQAITAAGGAIDVLTREGEGTTFRFELPWPAGAKVARPLRALAVAA
jgi:two-component system chemotaxis sensor kinase CheA